MFLSFYAISSMFSYFIGLNLNFVIGDLSSLISDLLIRPGDKILEPGDIILFLYGDAENKNLALFSNSRSVCFNSSTSGFAGISICLF
jgi:hypothetical protein